MAPIILAALAVTVPARAGLINVGGEGQLVIGGVAAAGVVDAAIGDGCHGTRDDGPDVRSPPRSAARLWAGIAGVLRLAVGHQRGGHDAAAQLRRARLACSS